MLSHEFGDCGFLTDDPGVMTFDVKNFHHRAAEFAEAEGKIGVEF
jgi:hypothetical protein